VDNSLIAKTKMVGLFYEKVNWLFLLVEDITRLKTKISRRAQGPYWNVHVKCTGNTQQRKTHGSVTLA